MELDGNDHIEFSRFCTLNNQLWTHIFPAPVSPVEPGVILVDLFHDNPGYLLRNLLIAKYLQCHLGFEIIGLSGTPGVVKQSCLTINPSLNVELAKSFGVTTVWLSPDIQDADYKEAGDLLETIGAESPSSPLTPEILRRRLKTLTSKDGFPIGRFIYDTTVRSELCATVKDINPSLKKWTAHAIVLERWVNEHLSAFGIDHSLYFVTGHLDYNPWGLIAEKVCRTGGEIFWFRSENNIPLYNLKRYPDHQQTLNAVYHALETEWFNTVIWPNQKKFASGQKTYAKANATRAFYQRWTMRNCPDVPSEVADRAAEEWRLSYGWDQNTPVVGVFAHAFADQPLADEQLYDDRYVWLAETLAFAAEHPERNWLIKIHPVDLSYDRVGTSRDLMERYGKLPHLRFAQGETAFNVIQTLCDVGVTIFGFPGLQMASAGKPVIVAGNGPYAECGFVYRPKDIEDYKKLLLTDPSLLQLTKEQIERAQLYEYTSALSGAPASSFLEPITYQSGSFFWHRMCARLSHHNLLSDDLYLGLTTLLANQYGRIRHPFVERYYLDLPTQSHQDMLSSQVLDKELPVRFSSAYADKIYRIQGFSSPAKWGMWTNSDTACLAMQIAPDATKDAMLVIDYRSMPRPLGFASLAVSVFINNKSCGSFSGFKKKGKLYLALPELPGDQDLIILRLIFQNLVPLCRLRLSEDRGCYGLALVEARLVQRSDIQKDLRMSHRIISALTNIGWRMAATILYLQRLIMTQKKN